MEKYLSVFSDVKPLVFDDIVVVIDSVFQMIVMCRQMCINEAQGTAVSCHSNRDSSFVSLQRKKLIKILIYLEVLQRMF